jgi:hypothetical protein
VSDMAERWTLKQTAEDRQVKEKHLRELVERGVIPPGVAIRYGRRIFIDPKALEAWERGGGAGWPGGWRREAEGGAGKVALGGA